MAHFTCDILSGGLLLLPKVMGLSSHPAERQVISVPFFNLLRSGFGMPELESHAD